MNIKERCQNTPKISFVFDCLDTFTSRIGAEFSPINLISQQKLISVKDLANLPLKKNDSQQESLKHFKFLEMKCRKKKRY